jgi:hypothetical protein
MHRWSRTLTRCGVLMVVGCGDGGVPPLPDLPPMITLVAGGTQAAPVGFPLPESVVIRVESATGTPLANERVQVSIDVPFAEVRGLAAATATDGTFPIAWRTGSLPGVQRATISLPGYPTATPLVVEATATSRAVRSMAGGAPVFCAVGLDGALGCFAPTRDAASPPPFVAAAGAGPFRDLAIHVRDGEQSPGCAVAESGRIWCFAVDTGARVRDMLEMPGNYPAMQSVHTGGIDQRAAPPFCALAADGSAWCWGANDSGVLGDGTLVDRGTPVPVQTPLRFTRLAVGSEHACGIVLDGTAWCWGRNTLGQVGRAPVGGVIPTPVLVDPDLRFVVIAIVRDDVSCGIGTGGGLRCWGNKSRLGLGELATAIEGNAVPRPTPPLDVLASLAVAALDSAVVAIESEGRGSWWGALPVPTDILRTDRARPFDQRLPFTRLLIPVTRGALCGPVGPTDNVVCVRVGALTGYGFADLAPDLRVFGVPS